MSIETSNILDVQKDLPQTNSIPNPANPLSSRDSDASVDETSADDEQLEDDESEEVEDEENISQDSEKDLA